MPQDDVPPDSGCPDNQYFNLLVVDKSLADRVVAIDKVKKYLTENYPHLTLRPHQLEHADKALDFLIQQPIDLVIFDANFNVLPGYKSNMPGLDQFIVPARMRGYQTPAICWAHPIYRELALSAGSDAFISKANGDYKDIPELIKQILAKKQESVSTEPSAVLV